jgi:hypothetical protein
VHVARGTLHGARCTLHVAHCTSTCTSTLRFARLQTATLGDLPA